MFRHLCPWVSAVWLLALLALICGLAHQRLGVPLQLVALGGLAVQAGVLLWVHRQKLHRLTRKSPPV